MADKKLTNLYLREDVIAYYIRKAQEELEDEGESVNKVSLQRRRSRLMVDLLTDLYESDGEEE